MPPDINAKLSNFSHMSDGMGDPRLLIGFSIDRLLPGIPSDLRLHQ
jgi:hypothetical protein